MQADANADGRGPVVPAERALRRNRGVCAGFGRRERGKELVAAGVDLMAVRARDRVSKQAEQVADVISAVNFARDGGLELSVRDDDGFVMTAQPQGWQAIFGNYTPNLRPTDLIPSQVQCLASLLRPSEADVGTVYLAPLDGRCGTYLPAGTPSESPTAR